MTSSAEPLPRLALRLRALRTEGLAGRPITQRQRSQALSAGVPLISSWESTRKPTVPVLRRLEDYATFFATERSVAGHQFRLLPIPELNAEERARRDEVFQPILRRDGEDHILVEDVAHFYRGPNPFNQNRTLTMCNGIFGRGTLGAVAHYWTFASGIETRPML